jgi:hypothetical protein
MEATARSSIISTGIPIINRHIHGALQRKERRRSRRRRRRRRRRRARRERGVSLVLHCMSRYIDIE